MELKTTAHNYQEYRFHAISEITSKELIIVTQGIDRGSAKKIAEEILSCNYYPLHYEIKH